MEREFKEEQKNIFSRNICCPPLSLSLSLSLSLYLNYVLFVPLLSSPLLSL
jgi:hypothetical protein